MQQQGKDLFRPDWSYLPARNPKTKAANPSNPCNSQFDFGFPTSASFNQKLA
jgi:hypothetical protein